MPSIHPILRFPLLPLLLLALGFAGCSTGRHGDVPNRAFHPQLSTPAFANETKWIYGYDSEGKWRGKPSSPEPQFTLRCFNMARMTRAFHYHAEFQPDLPPLTPAEEAERVQAILRRDSRAPSPATDRIPLPGHSHLHEFSQRREGLLKEAVGGAWRSYLQRGNWRMVFPFPSRHQANVAKTLRDQLELGRLPIVHVARFPALTINHALLVHAATSESNQVVFHCVDPNQPGIEETLTFSDETRRFTLSPTPYFPGGQVDVYAIYRNWLY